MTIRVVLADDEPLVRSGIAMLLSSDPGIEVVGEAGNGQEAVAMAAELRPDVVVMDVRMPLMDGVEATRRVTSASGDGPSVLMLTTYNLDEAVYSALCAGATGFLLKDAAPAELLNAVRALASGEGWLDPGVTRSLVREFAARSGALPAGVAGLAGVTYDVPAHPAAAGSFHLQGDMWSISFGGAPLYLRDSVGLKYLCQLLRNPAAEMHVLDLVGSVQPDPGTTEAARRVAASLGDAGPLLDAESKLRYRRRVEELREEIAEAEDWADAGRAAIARQELEVLMQELARATGLGGRDRMAASAAERARISVTKAVKATIRRIDREDVALGRHLKVSVHTGLFCCYSPEDSTIRWDI